MALWAAVVALVLGLLMIVTADPSTVLVSVGEIVAVLAMFTLICAAEASN